MTHHRTLISVQKTWAKDGQGKRGWCIKRTYSDGSVEWDFHP